MINQNLATVNNTDKSHQKLVDFVADNIKKSGLTPKKVKFIDLVTKHNDITYFFIIKSFTDDNAGSQIRLGLNQLYEYRYLQNLPDAKLVLVIEKSLPEKNNWMTEYLEKDRDVFLIWDGDNNLFGTKHAKEKLSFLNIA